MGTYCAGCLMGIQNPIVHELKTKHSVQTKFYSLWSSGAIWWHWSRSTLAQVMACFLRFRDIHRWAILQRVTKLLFEFKIILLKVLPHLSWASESKHLDPTLPTFYLRWVKSLKWYAIYIYINKWINIYIYIYIYIYILALVRDIYCIFVLNAKTSICASSRNHYCSYK